MKNFLSFMFKVLLIIISTWLSSNLIFATTYHQFDTIVGPKPTSLGYAFSSLSNDGSGLYLNPAGMAMIQNNHVQVTSFKQLEATNSTIETVYRYNNITIGFGFKYSQLDGFQETVEEDGVLQETGKSFNYSGSLLVIGLAGSTLDDDLLWGITISKLSQRLYEKSTTGGYASDIGLLYRTTNAAISCGIKRFISVPLTWSTNMSEPLHKTYYLGANKEFFNHFRLLGEVEFNNGFRPQYKTGMEYHIANRFFVRAGATFEEETLKLLKKVSLDYVETHIGLGLDLGVLELDYSLSIPSKELSTYLDSVYKVSIQFRVL